jgi:hypothetical protein
MLLAWGGGMELPARLEALIEAEFEQTQKMIARFCQSAK